MPTNWVVGFDTPGFTVVRFVLLKSDADNVNDADDGGGIPPC